MLSCNQCTSHKQHCDTVMKPIDTLLLQISLLVAHVASGTMPLSLHALLVYRAYTLLVRKFELITHHFIVE
jgi:hypothetical protein